MVQGVGEKVRQNEAVGQKSQLIEVERLFKKNLLNFHPDVIVGKAQKNGAQIQPEALEMANSCMVIANQIRKEMKEENLVELRLLNLRMQANRLFQFNSQVERLSSIYKILVSTLESISRNDTYPSPNNNKNNDQSASELASKFEYQVETFINKSSWLLTLAQDTNQIDYRHFLDPLANLLNSVYSDLKRGAIVLSEPVLKQLEVELGELNSDLERLSKKLKFAGNFDSKVILTDLQMLQAQNARKIAFSLQQNLIGQSLSENISLYLRSLTGQF